MLSPTLAAVPAKAEPERRAWRILVAAFTVFLMLCGLLAYAIWWFVFQSTLPLATELTVAQGTASIIEPNTDTPSAETYRRSDLEEGVAIRTNDRTQAVITFADPSTAQPITSVVMFQNSEIRIQTAQSPRFSLNRRPYWIVIEVRTGNIEVLALDTTRRAVELAIFSPHMSAQLETGGQYQVVVSSASTRVTSERGRARVTQRNGTSSVVLGDNRQTVVEEEGASLDVIPAERKLLENGNFEEPLTRGWEPYNDYDPPGQAYNTTFDGRSVVVIDRSQSLYPGQQLSHAETGLVQHNLSIDISRYRSVNFRVTFFIAEQSLSGCGDQASECPLIFLVKFLDKTGAERSLRNGFFATYNPNLAWPLRCDTCFDFHERVSAGSWFTYETTNIFFILTGDQRPVTLTEVSLYASGHAYKIYISEVQLLATD